MLSAEDFPLDMARKKAAEQDKVDKTAFDLREGMLTL